MTVFRILGGVLAIIGGLGIFFAMSMDTTVETDFGRVHNIGLLAEQRNAVMIACVMFFGGLVLIGVGELASRGTKEPDVPETTCPECRLPIPPLARICGQCNQPIVWVYDMPMTPKAANDLRLLEEAEAERRLMEEYAETERKQQQKRIAAEKSMRRLEAVIGRANEFIRSIPRTVDNVLFRAAGEENLIIYRFLQIAVYGLVPLVAIVSILLLCF